MKCATCLAQGGELNWPDKLMHDSLNVCSRCGQHFKNGQKLGQLPIVDGGPVRWHKRCPKPGKARTAK